MLWTSWSPVGSRRRSTLRANRSAALRLGGPATCATPEPSGALANFEVDDRVGGAVHTQYVTVRLPACRSRRPPTKRHRRS